MKSWQLQDSEDDPELGAVLPAEGSCWEAAAAAVLPFFDFWNNTSRNVVMDWKEIKVPACIW